MSGIARTEAERALDAFNSVIAKVKVPAEDLRGAQLIVKVLREAATTQGAVAALREIATRPVVELNPDGDDQAAHTMQMIAREALERLEAKS